MNKKIKFGKIILSLTAIAMGAFHMYTGYSGMLPPLLQRSYYTLFVFIVGFFLYPKKDKLTFFSIFINTTLTFLAISAIVYQIYYHDAILRRPAMPTTMQIIFGTILILMIFELGRRTSGLVLPVVTSLVIAYTLFGHLFPRGFAHAGVDYNYLIYYLYNSYEGIFGVPIGITAKYIYLFMLFGALLIITGAADVVFQIAQLIVGKAKDAPAKIAVIGSALFGSVSGSATANVMATGSITIPLMIKMGYSKDYAAAIESTASTGGVIMPPIMGSVAFIMAEFMGVSYLTIVYKAIVPAILYYTALLLMVHIQGVKLRLKGKLKEIDLLEENDNMSERKEKNLFQLIKKKGHLLLGLVVLVYLLVVVRLSPNLCAFWGIVVTIVAPFLKKGTRLSFKQIIEGFEKGLDMAVSITPPLAMAGMISGMAITTGLVTKITSLLTAIGGSSLIILLLLGMIVAIILGTGVTDSVAYILTSLFLVPALVKSGISPISANFFVLYFATVSYITPPVALAVYAAVSIAGSDLVKTGIQAVKLGIAGFLVPYLIIYKPEILLEGKTTLIIWNIFTALLAVCLISFVLESWILQKIVLWERLLLILSIILLFYRHFALNIFGIIISVIVLGAHIIKYRNKTENLSGQYVT